jgi:hypothetical protein
LGLTAAQDDDRICLVQHLQARHDLGARLALFSRTPTYHEARSLSRLFREKALDITGGVTPRVPRGTLASLAILAMFV